MTTEHRQARDYLNDLPRTDFWDVVAEAKISEDIQRVLDLKFVKGWDHTKISYKLHMTVSNVDKIVGKAYDKIAKLINA